ncbi:MAG: type II toxin-antitoxin system Phd/YefM family antitoxin [Nitrospinota bacterium]|nr:MAG: type II toxin-antitoxin system Phd/YefM family antitoxin [Nitrospinota bacterium]
MTMSQRKVHQLSTSDARNHFADLVNRVAYGKEQVILRRHGQALVAVIPLEDWQRLQGQALPPPSHPSRKPQKGRKK